MKNIIAITDSAKIADMEFKSLRQSLTDKGLLVKSDAMHWMLYTQQLMILFWNIDAGTHPLIPMLHTIAYSDCKIGIRENEPIMSQIRKWQRIERLIEHIPPNAKEIPYSDIENLKIWEVDKICSAGI
nr:MAG TPA: hypothetical protein [Caudoviricetes sp.]